jgi:putative ABC transport system substrate-binding protein
MIERREFITLLGAAAATWPRAGRAQQGARVRWIGALILAPESDQFARESTAVLEQSLAKLGWTVGRNVAIDYQWGVNDPEKARIALAQVMRLGPDVLFVHGGPGLTAAQQVTATVPIVFAGVSEPVERGFVTSMARPGGNTTGFTNLEASVGGKFIELLKEIAPRVTRVTAMFNPASTFAVQFFRSAEAAAPQLGLDVVAAHVADPAEIDTAVTALAREPGAGLILPPDGFTPTYRRQIADLTTRYRVPAIAQNRAFAAEGVLASYGPDGLDSYQRAGGYVDRILRGEKPADLPVQSPVKFELVINLKTAKALGLDVPFSLQQRADEVIE